MKIVRRCEKKKGFKGWDGGASVRERNGDGGYGYGCGASGSRLRKTALDKRPSPPFNLYFSSAILGIPQVHDHGANTFAEGQGRRGEAFGLWAAGRIVKEAAAS